MKEKREVLNLNGYRMLLAPEHPRAYKSRGYKGYMCEHVLIAEEQLGRLLKEDEEVHHLDLNKENNRKENLLVLMCSQHSKLHAWLRAGKPTSYDSSDGSTRDPIPAFCEGCSKTLQTANLRYCSRDCCTRLAPTKRPAKNELQKDLLALSMEAIGRKYGVTGNTAKKWVLAYKLIELPACSLVD